MLLKRKKKFFAILLVLTMIFQVSMPVAYAGEIPTYVAFDELAEDVRNKTVPVGTTKEAIIATLPTAVGGTLLETATTTGSALSVTVNIEEWKCYDFSSEVPGEEYYFIGTPPWPHEIATGVEYPKVKVKIAKTKTTLVVFSHVSNGIIPAANNRALGFFKVEKNNCRGRIAVFF